MRVYTLEYTKHMHTLDAYFRNSVADEQAFGNTGK